VGAAEWRVHCACESSAPVAGGVGEAAWRARPVVGVLSPRRWRCESVVRWRVGVGARGRVRVWEESRPRQSSVLRQLEGVGECARGKS